MNRRRFFSFWPVCLLPLPALALAKADQESPKFELIFDKDAFMYRLFVWDDGTWREIVMPRGVQISRKYLPFVINERLLNG